MQQGCFSGAPQKQSQSRDGAAQGPNHPVEREHERPFVQGAHRKGWRGRGGDFTVLNVLIKKQEWEAEQCTRGQRKWWQSGGFHVTEWWFPCPECQPSTVATRQQQKEQSSATSLPLPEHCQDHIPNPHNVCCGVATGVCGLREFLRHVGESSDTGGA